MPNLRVVVPHLRFRQGLYFPHSKGLDPTSLVAVAQTGGLAYRAGRGLKLEAGQRSRLVIIHRFFGGGGPEQWRINPPSVL